MKSYFSFSKSGSTRYFSKLYPCPRAKNNEFLLQPMHPKGSRHIVTVHVNCENQMSSSGSLGLQHHAVVLVFPVLGLPKARSIDWPAGRPSPAGRPVRSFGLPPPLITQLRVLEKPVLERSEVRYANPVGPRSSAGCLSSKKLDPQSVSSISSVTCPRTPCGDGVGQAAVHRPDPAALFGDKAFGGGGVSCARLHLMP